MEPQPRREPGLGWPPCSPDGGTARFSGRRDLRKGTSIMLGFIHSLKRVANRFAQICKPKSVAQINRSIMTIFRSVWEPLILYLLHSRK